MKSRSALLATVVFALPFTASAQPVTGLYVGAGVGVNLTQDETVRSITGSTASGAVGSTVGSAAIGSLRWGLGNALRAKIEGNFRYNQFDGASGFGTGSKSGGNEQKPGMYGLIYDFADLTFWVQPSIGAGVGYEGLFEQGLTVAGGGDTFATNMATKAAFGYRAILGAAVPIAPAPGLAMTAEYRFLGLAGDRTYGGTLTTGGGSITSSIKLNNDYDHAVLLGVRYNLSQIAPTTATPAAAPVPEVHPTRSYLVFFDWDQATLTDRTRQIIQEAADNSTRVQYTRIEANGYTDTSGAPNYNRGLSMRRAESVAAELIKDGVPSNAISIQGFGDTRLLVPTGAGVRKSQNRRVEIIVR
jgi:OmpA-OmpF porin, OOP family